jgi:Kef-type K+ transport system membrane component KefB
MVTVANAADEQAARPSEFLLLVQIALLIAVGRGLGDVMQRIGQPSVMGELLCGLLLGPSLFGWVWPEAQHAIFPSSPEQKALLDGIAQFGILLLLLLTGMETDLGLVRKVGKAAIAISITGIFIPSSAVSRSASSCQKAFCRIRKRVSSHRCFLARPCRSLR